MLGLPSVVLPSILSSLSPTQSDYPDDLGDDYVDEDDDDVEVDKGTRTLPLPPPYACIYPGCPYHIYGASELNDCRAGTCGGDVDAATWRAGR